MRSALTVLACLSLGCALFQEADRQAARVERSELARIFLQAPAARHPSELHALMHDGALCLHEVCTWTRRIDFYTGPVHDRIATHHVAVGQEVRVRCQAPAPNVVRDCEVGLQ